MSKSITTTHNPKAYAKDAVKRLGILISTIKHRLDERDLDLLRDWYKFALAYDDADTLYKMVKHLNYKEYLTGSSFQILTTFTHEHGQTLEIKETRF